MEIVIQVDNLCLMDNITIGYGLDLELDILAKRMSKVSVHEEKK